MVNRSSLDRVRQDKAGERYASRRFKLNRSSPAPAAIKRRVDAALRGADPPSGSRIDGLRGPGPSSSLVSSEPLKLRARGLAGESFALGAAA